VNKLNKWPLIGCVVAAAVVAGCGGSGNSSSSASLRLVNATLTHSSLDLLINASVAIPATTQDSVSVAAAPSSGSVTLQINDSNTATALVSSIVSLAGGQHYTVVAYESGGALKTAALTEDFVTPASGTAQMRFYDASTDAGSLDVYVTTDTVTPWNVYLASPIAAAPQATVTADTSPTSSGWGLYTPGTYRVYVTGAGNKADLRNGFLGTTVTLTSQQTATVLLTPASGGLLVNGSTVIQQGAYSALRNATARVRLVGAVSANAVVAATAGSTTIDAGNVAPTVGDYVIVPAPSVLAVNVNGTAVAPPAATLTPGSDATLLVYGDPGAATASLIADDNRRPSVSTNVKLRLVNGITGMPGALAMSANFTTLASGVAAGAASSYGLLAGSTSMQIDVTSALSPTELYHPTGLNVGSDKVYTLFMLGDFGTPRGILVKDSKDR
jgi:hypothetical protein